ncbi:unnamed protein product [Leuciscus chuanchicus]
MLQELNVQMESNSAMTAQVAKSVEFNAKEIKDCQSKTQTLEKEMKGIGTENVALQERVLERGLPVMAACNLLFIMPPPKGATPGQQTTKTTRSNNGAMVATASVNKATQPPHLTHFEDDARETTTNSEILDAIRSLRADMEKHSADTLEAIRSVKGDVQAHSRRLDEAEERISRAEDDVASLQGKVQQLEQTVADLSSKITSYEDRNRRSNLRLVGLPEKSEDKDMCGFLEKWLTDALGDCFTSPPIIERAHRIGSYSPKATTSRVVIMKFLNYRDRETAMTAARKMKEIFYKDHRLSLFPDLSPETRRLQRRFDGVKAKLRALNIRYGMLYPAQLMITHNERRIIFKSDEEAEDYVRKMRPQPAADDDGD